MFQIYCFPYSSKAQIQARKELRVFLRLILALLAMNYITCFLVVLQNRKDLGEERCRITLRCKKYV